MRSFFSLLLLLASSVVLFILPETLLGLPMSHSGRIYRLWMGSQELLAVPFCLMLLCFTKSTLIRVSKLLWGLWMTLLTAAVLLTLNEVAPEVTLWGTVLLGLTMIFGLSLTLFSTIELSKLAPPLIEEKKPEEINAIDLSAVEIAEDPELARKVEGA